MYDPAGNATSIPSICPAAQCIQYDAENRQSAFQSSGTTYQYDGNGRRVLVSQGGTSTIYVYDAQGQLAAKYYSGSTGTLPCSTCFLSWDHLGSTRMVTDAAGKLVSRHDYMPFGEEIVAGFAGRPTGTGSAWNTADPILQKFTGKERDVDSGGNVIGLDYFSARYYGSALGRWTSTDPLSGWPSQPQSWNRYVYALNNPLRYIDPNGMASYDENGSWVGDYNGERDCSTNLGCLYWNSNSHQWDNEDPNPPPSLADLPGQFFVGFGELALNNNPHELWRIPYSIAADLTGGAILSKGFQVGSTWWKLRNAKFAQTWAREAFSKGGKFAGQTVDDVAKALQTGVLDPSDVPIELVQTPDGTNVLLNTRSTVALTISGTPTALWKLVDSTTDLGANLRLAQQLANNPGAPTSTVTLVPSQLPITIGH